MVETVTVLFTDLVGSTELLSRVGEERAEQLRREHFALLRQAVADHGGREVKSLGDGLMVVFESVTGALAAGAAMQQALRARNDRAPERLVVRVGVSHGEADVDGDDYFGVPVIEAARLCSRAAADEVLVTDVVRALAGSRGGFAFEPLGEVELKGLGGPVAAHRLVWERVVPAATVPLPSRIVAALREPLVGRARELAWLGDALKTAAEGMPRLVVVAGEPGIGKTALASAFARAAFEGHAIVLYGRCDEDVRMPYGPWAEALGHLVRHAPESLLAAHVTARRGALARLVPELAARAPADAGSSTDPESERYLLFSAVVDALARTSDIAPVVLVLDDLHWADRPTMQLLRHVVTSDAPTRLLVLGAFRDSDVGAGHPLADALAAMHRESRVERLTIRGLDDDELLALLEANAGHEMAAEGIALRDALQRETGGNPFFVGEILRHLAETRAIYVDDSGRWAARADLRSSGLPVSIREVVDRRVARLGDEAGRVLAAAAVIGRDFDVTLLRRIVDTDEETLVDVLDRAVRAAIVNEGDAPGEFRFAHALIEHSLYEDLTALRRAQAHRRIAEALEDLSGGRPGVRASELAYHWAHATQPQDAVKAIEYAQLAGDQALEQLAPEEAMRWYRNALELLERSGFPGTRHHAVLLAGLGDAERQAGDPAHRDTLLTAARLADSLDDVDTLVRAVLANSRGFHSLTGEVDDERVGMLQRALERLGRVDSPRRARLLATLCGELAFGTEPLERRLALAEEAVAVARSGGDPIALAEALVGTYVSICVPRTLDTRVRWTAEACALADIDHPVTRVVAQFWGAVAAFEAGDAQTFVSRLAVVRADAERIGQPLHLWQSSMLRTLDAMRRGDLAVAEREAEVALELGIRSGAPDIAVIYGAALLSVRFWQARLDEMGPFVQQARRDFPTLGILRAAECLVAAEGDDRARARAMLEACLADAAAEPRDLTWLGEHVVLAWAARRVEHVEAARVLLERLAPWESQVGTVIVTWFGAVSSTLGSLAHVVGRFDEAERRFAYALDVHERMETPPFAALTRVEWSEMLVDRAGPGDHDRAREMLAAARAAARRHALPRIERDALRVLARPSPR